MAIVYLGIDLAKSVFALHGVDEGGKCRLGRITKAGDPYLRWLLVLGARAVLGSAKNKSDAISRRAVALAEQRGYWRAIVAIAAENARLCWAMG